MGRFLSGLLEIILKPIYPYPNKKRTKPLNSTQKSSHNAYKSGLQSKNQKKYENRSRKIFWVKKLEEKRVSAFYFKQKFITNNFLFLDEKCFCEVLLIILFHDHVRSFYFLKHYKNIELNNKKKAQKKI